MGYLTIINAHLIIAGGHAEALQLPVGVDTFSAACEWAIRVAPQYADTAISITDTSPGTQLTQRLFKFDSERNCIMQMTRRKGWQRIPDLNMEQQ